MLELQGTSCQLKWTQANVKPRPDNSSKHPDNIKIRNDFWTGLVITQFSNCFNNPNTQSSHKMIFNGQPEDARNPET